VDVSSLADAAAVAASIVAVVTLMPQLRRLRRTGDVAGVSLTWAFLGAVTNAAWFGYLLSQRLWAGMPSVVCMVVLYGALASALVRRGVAWRSPTLLAVLWSLFLAALGPVGGLVVLGLVLGLSYGVQVAPSVWSAYRTWAPSGVSPGTWAIALVEVSLWGLYGLGKGDVPIQVFALTGISSSLAMLARWAATRRRMPAALSG
jgi:uncharacterized protein with PQ loop repeat